MMKVSIVTVNLNGNRFLSETINSILEQTYKDLELLIVDGGSTDGSLDTIRAAAEQDSRVKWISEQDRGIADAMNKGIRMASGELLGILHSDDRYPEPSTLARVVECLSTAPDAVWLTGGIDMINEAGKVIQTFPVRKYSYQRLLRSNILFHPATFVRTEVLRCCGMFTVGLKLAMDYDLWLKLGAISDPVLVSASLACFRMHDASISTRDAGKAMCEEFSVRRRYMKEKGRWVWPYSCHHQLKMIANFFFMRRLRGQAKGTNSNA